MRVTPPCLSLLLILALSESRFPSFAGEAPSPSAGSETPPQSAIDEYISRQMDSQHIPGLSIAVVRAGKLVAAKGYGKASVELDAPATPETLYALASVSKQFTAAAILLLVEAGKIGLNDPLTNYFSWLPSEWSEVKVPHLLTHTSGIPEEQYKGDFLEWERQEHKQEDIVRTAFGPLLARPGEKFQYSNTGYRLLGMLIEKVSGQSYWDFLEEHIFHPLGMTATRNSDPQTVITNRARGYGVSDGRLINRDPVTASSAFAQGALISSVLDMAKWDAALNSEVLIKKSSLEQMWTPVRLNDGTTSNYGFGWFLRPVKNHKAVGHGGDMPGFTSFIWRFIDDRLTVVVLANCEPAQTARIALGVAGLYVPALLSP
jgi:CubicO group peptidase (beta-lactamase class C family)